MSLKLNLLKQLLKEQKELNSFWKNIIIVIGG